MRRKNLKPVHPGEILSEEFMAPLGLSMNKMALGLRVPVTRIANIVNAAYAMQSGLNEEALDAGNNSSSANANPVTLLQLLDGSMYELTSYQVT